MLTLNPASHLAEPGNTEKILKNVSPLRAYAEGLEITVRCYESQGK